MESGVDGYLAVGGVDGTTLFFLDGLRLGGVAGSLKDGRSPIIAYKFVSTVCVYLLLLLCCCNLE